MSTAFANEFIPYNVSQLSGIQLWLDAADSSSMTLSGSTVTAWRDKSGLSNNATINNSVTFNASDKSVRTDGTNGYFTSPLDTRKSTSTYYNVFLVYKWLSSSSNTNQSLWGNDVGGGWNRFQLLSFPSATGIAYGLSRGATSPNTTNITALNTSNTLLYSANYAYNITNGSYAYVNGSQSINFTEVAASPETSTQLIFFGQLGSDQYFASIAFYEIIVARLEISTQTRQAIEGYLAWKWGLQNNLPSTHPYSLSPFYAFPPFPITNKVPKATNQSPFSANLYIGVAKPYDPTKVSGCQIWLDAADRNSLTVSNSVVTLVRNKVDNSSLTPSGSSTSSLTLVNSSIGKLQSLSFNNLSTYNVWLQGSFGNISTGSSFVVWKALSQKVMPQWSPFFAWYSKSGSTYGSYPAFGYLGGTTNLTIGPYTTFASPNGTPTTQLTADTNYLGFYGWSNTTTSVGLNGATPTSGTQPSFSGSTTTFLIGQDGDINGPADAWAATNMNLGEILIFNRTITSIERQEIEGYLAWKWGLQGSLPQTHPWKLFPPPPN